MKNCQGSPQNLIDSLDNITLHYQNQHDKCDPSSQCKSVESYFPSRIIIQDKVAVKLLENCIKKLYIYKHPEKYVNCIDTHFVESFNNVVLIYLDKRIHYGNVMYQIRIGLAILDWNNNVSRDVYSTKIYRSVRNPDQQTPSRSLKPKQLDWCTRLWKSYCNCLEG